MDGGSLSYALGLLALLFVISLVGGLLVRYAGWNVSYSRKVLHSASLAFPFVLYRAGLAVPLPAAILITVSFADEMPPGPEFHQVVPVP